MITLRDIGVTGVTVKITLRDVCVTGDHTEDIGVTGECD